MTEQMFVFRCREVRKFAFDYRRGELQPAELRKIEEHVEQCEACHGYLNKLEGMLDAAAIHDYTPKTDRDDLFERIVAEARSDEPERLDRDQLFDRITAEIDKPELRPKVSDEALQLAEPAETVETDRDEEPRTRRPIALYVVAALAAGILIGVSLSFLYPLDPEPTVAPAEIALKSEEDAGDKPTPTVQVVALDTLTLQPTPAEFDDVRVFGEAEASWEIRTQGKRRKLTLDEGTVLVEFVPKKQRELEFVAEKFTVRVTGTVFYASAEKGIVGVVTGSVEVDTRDGETVELSDGQEWVLGQGLRDAPEVVRPQAERHVEIAAHQAALERARAETKDDPPPTVEAPRPPMTREVKQTPRAALRESADQALRDSRYDVAAQYYERMVEELSAADPANASLRLDLARIYIRHLGQQRRALVHLRRFVNDRPNDSLTPAARTELCRIADEVGANEPECRP